MAPTPAPVTRPSETKNAARRVINFAAGPSQLPEAALQQAQQEFFDFNGTGCNLMELSHRGSAFKAVITEAEALLRQLLRIPANYRVLFMQGGGSGQFAAIPLNLIGRSATGTADYIVTGRWSAAAAKEAEKFCTVNHVVRETKAGGIPDPSTWQFSEDAAYVFMCDNETVDGVEFLDIPDTPEDVPLVADMSSNLLSRHFDIERFGLVFAGAQKNMGPAGLTVVIVRDDLLGSALPACPSVLNYQVMSRNGSMYNTPPTYAIYITNLVLRWIKEMGGVDKMYELALQKSGMLYDFIEQSNGVYFCPVEKSCRSRMNVVYRIAGGEAVEKKFVEQANRRGLMQLEGHRSVGGLRASLYNAVSVSDTRQLIEFMREFAEGVRSGQTLAQ